MPSLGFSSNVWVSLVFLRGNDSVLVLRFSFGEIELHFSLWGDVSPFEFDCKLLIGKKKPLKISPLQSNSKQTFS